MSSQAAAATSLGSRHAAVPKQQRTTAAVTSRRPRNALRTAVVRAAVSEPPPSSTASPSEFVPEWKLPREPLSAGKEPEQGSWGPTNQTIDDWRSIYRNTTLSTTDGSAPRAIPATRITGTIPKDLTAGALYKLKSVVDAQPFRQPS